MAKSYCAILFDLDGTLIDPKEGDRHLDMIAAVQNGIDPLGAAYGYGSRDELMQAGALALCHSPQEVYQWVRG